MRSLALAAELFSCDDHLLQSMARRLRQLRGGRLQLGVQPLEVQAPARDMALALGHVAGLPAFPFGGVDVELLQFLRSNIVEKLLFHRISHECKHGSSLEPSVSSKALATSTQGQVMSFARTGWPVSLWALQPKPLTSLKRTPVPRRLRRGLLSFLVNDQE